MSETCSGCGATLPGDGATYGPIGYPLCLHCWLADAETAREWWRLGEAKDRAIARRDLDEYFRLDIEQGRLDPAGTKWRLGA